MKLGDSAHLFFPRMGESPMITDARADLTCWLASTTSSFTQGNMLFMMTVSCVSYKKKKKKNQNFSFALEKNPIFRGTIYLDGGVEGFTEVANLVRGRSANLRLAVLQKTLKYIEMKCFIILIFIK